MYHPNGNYGTNFPAPPCFLLYIIDCSADTLFLSLLLFFSYNVMSRQHCRLNTRRGIFPFFPFMSSLLGWFILHCLWYKCQSETDDRLLANSAEANYVVLQKARTITAVDTVLWGLWMGEFLWLKVRVSTLFAKSLRFQYNKYFANYRFPFTLNQNHLLQVNLRKLKSIINYDWSMHHFESFLKSGLV